MQMDFEISRWKNSDAQCRFLPPPPFFFLRRWFSICISLFTYCFKFSTKEKKYNYFEKKPSYINNKTLSHKTLQQEL